jgi:hypothetical protein
VLSERLTIGGKPLKNHRDVERHALAVATTNNLMKKGESEKEGTPYDRLQKSFDKSQNYIKIKTILLHLNQRKETRPCGLHTSGFARYPIAKRVAIAGPSHDRGGRSRKSPGPWTWGFFFETFLLSSPSALESHGGYIP